jgi:hypothetical protein
MRARCSRVLSCADPAAAPLFARLAMFAFASALVVAPAKAQVVVPAGPVSVAVGVVGDAVLWPRRSPTWLSANIDSSSLRQNISFGDPALVNAVRQLAPLVLRVGGSASNALTYSTANEPCGTSFCQPRWLALLQFVNATGAELLFCFGSVHRLANGTWNSSGVPQMLSAAVANGFGPTLQTAKWQTGNEIGGNGTLRATDFYVIQRYSQSFGVSDELIGPSVSTANSFRADFLAAMGNGSALSYFSFHNYVMDKGTQCNLTWFLNLPKTTATYISAIAQQRAVTSIYAPGIRLSQEEMASAPQSGCPGLSNTFAAGFVYVASLVQLALSGADLVGRQDIFGYSFVGQPSYYSLLGPPGRSVGIL